MTEVTFCCPGSQIWRGENADFKINRVSNHHDPSLRWLVPDDFGITELCTVASDYRVSRIFDKGISVIVRVGNLLCLSFGGIQRVDSDHAICLIGEKARSVVRIYDSTTTED